MRIKKRSWCQRQ